jgi:hypothetical protein
VQTLVRPCQYRRATRRSPIRLVASGTQRICVFDLSEDDQLRHLGTQNRMFSTSFPKNHRKQNRINKLIAALDEHTAACDALKAELGCVEADDLLEKLWDTISELVERMRPSNQQPWLGFRPRRKCCLLVLGWQRPRGRGSYCGGNHQGLGERSISCVTRCIVRSTGRGPPVHARRVYFQP